MATRELTATNIEMEPLEGYLGLYDDETETGFSLQRDPEGTMQLWLDQIAPCSNAIGSLRLEAARLVAELTELGQRVTGFSTVIVEFAFDQVEVERPLIAKLLRELLPDVPLDTMEPPPRPSAGAAVIRRQR